MHFVFCTWIFDNAKGERFVIITDWSVSINNNNKLDRNIETNYEFVQKLPQYSHEYQLTVTILSSYGQITPDWRENTVYSSVDPTKGVFERNALQNLTSTQGLADVSRSILFFFPKKL